MQAFETEVRQQLKRPQADVDAQIAAAQTDWDFAQSSDTFDHKLVTVFEWKRSPGLAVSNHPCTCLLVRIRSWLGKYKPQSVAVFRCP